ncbi:MAG: hypothetical protein CM15mP102_00540 [Flavobacteriales bacterium]|nr:MAG: hypothetical protein CM15mP102_00540 [Flavobacteriales bacterium]
MKVIKYFLDLISQGKEIYYVTGNHDELMRKFLNFKIQNFKIVNQIVLDTVKARSGFSMEMFLIFLSDSMANKACWISL